MLKRFWTALFKGQPVTIPGTAGLEEGHARGVTIGDLGSGGTRVILCRVGGRLHALDSLCPHEGGRLTTGPLVEGRLALCPLHNYLFDPKDGAVVRGTCGKARRYRVEEAAGTATLYL